MNHIYLIRLVLLKRLGFQSQKYGMPMTDATQSYTGTCIACFGSVITSGIAT